MKRITWLSVLTVTVAFILGSVSSVQGATVDELEQQMQALQRELSELRTQNAVSRESLEQRLEAVSGRLAFQGGAAGAEVGESVAIPCAE